MDNEDCSYFSLFLLNCWKMFAVFCVNIREYGLIQCTSTLCKQYKERSKA